MAALATVVAMIVVLSVLLFVAVVAAVVFAVNGRRSVSALRRERQQQERLGAQLADTTSSSQRAAERAEAAESRVRSAEQRAVVAERRAGEAEHRAEAAERRAESSERRVADERARADRLERAVAEVRAAAEEQRAAGPSVWPLERLRAEREWMEVVGPGVALPEPWDATVGAVAAGELAVIREVMGTPGALRRSGPGAVADPLRAAAVVRASVEILRGAARAGAQMDVTVAAAHMVVALEPGTPVPSELVAATEAAAEAGLTVQTGVDAAGRPEVRLDF